MVRLKMNEIKMFKSPFHTKGADLLPLFLSTEKQLIRFWPEVCLKFWSFGFLMIYNSIIVKVIN